MYMMDYHSCLAIRDGCTSIIYASEESLQTNSIAQRRKLEPRVELVDRCCYVMMQYTNNNLYQDGVRDTQTTFYDYMQSLRGCIGVAYSNSVWNVDTHWIITKFTDDTYTTMIDILPGDIIFGACKQKFSPELAAQLELLTK